MSDRTQSSVRTGSRTGDADAAEGGTPAGAPPITSTQSIPGAGSSSSQAGTPGSTGTAAAPAGTAGAAPVPPIPQAVAGTGQGVAGAAASDATDKGTVRSRGRGPAKSGGRGPRRARLQLRHIDIWSAFKISLVLSIALFFIWMVAVGLLYGVLGGLGVFDTLNELFGQLGSASGSDAASDVVTWRVVLGGAAVIGAINIVLMTAMCTVATFIYNLCSDLVGGLELTLSERD